jgi:6-phosphogluconolactonase
VSGLTTYPSRAALFLGLAACVAAQINVALAQKGRATLAVPGGTTPEPFFAILRKVDLDWSKVMIMLTDERFVPETSTRSNTRLLREHLMRDNAAAATLVPLVLPADQPEDVLAQLQAGVRGALPLDVCVLGMGTDLHTASIFPNADLLAQALADDAPVLLPMRAPGVPEARMTLTAPVLKGADFVHILITGPEKRVAFQQAMVDGPVSEAPVRVILHRAQIHFAQ